MSRLPANATHEAGRMAAWFRTAAICLSMAGGLATIVDHGWAEDAPTAACSEAYVAGQKLRANGKLIAARRALLTCSREPCTAWIQRDCAEWLADVERRMPSIVLAAKGVDGRDTSDVRVLLDGKEIATKLDGRPVAVDPGEHTLRFEHAHEPAIERTIVVAEGVKSRLTEVSFAQQPPGAERPPAGSPGEPVPDAPSPAAEEPVERGQPVAAYVLGAVSLAAFTSFAAFGIVALNEESELRDGCGQTASCDPDEVDAVFTKAVVADVSLGVGIVALGVGLALFLHHQLSEPSSTQAESSAWRLEVGPMTGGARLGATARF